jgi:protein SPT2
MARGQRAQASLGQVGKIQHKKIEKPPTKREREEMQAQKAQSLKKNLGPNGKFRSAGQSALANGRSGERDRAAIKKQAPEPAKKVKKAAVATTGYTGTARPKPGSTPSKPSASSSSRYDSPARYKDDKRIPASKKRRYDSEEEEEEEDEPDYASDASSDMEAAAFEVDEEEEEAARIARREDAAALAEENRLKREKEEKKRRLAAMAARNRR